MTCITSTNYSVVVNGNTSGNIVPSRGIRQGDPLSPYLFLLCREGLFTLPWRTFYSLFRDNRNKCFHGLKASERGPSIFNLLFTDDSIIFCIASIHDYNGIKFVLNLFKKATRQQINFEKSSLLFIPNTSADSIQHCTNILGVEQLMQNDRYLGLPLFMGGPRNLFFKISRSV